MLGPPTLPSYTLLEHSAHCPKTPKSEFFRFRKLLNLEGHEEVSKFILFPLKYPQMP